MAKKGKPKEASGDGEGDAAATTTACRGLSLVDHPKATRQIRTVRAWAALLGFAAILALALRAGRPFQDALARGLEAGVAGYLVGWATMVVAWRQLAQAEIEHARKRIVEALLELEAAERGGTTAG